MANLSEDSGFIPPDEYVDIIRQTQIVSADLIIFNQRGEILLGKRNNSPAKNTWFVPGGRVRKYETITDAVKRISLQEVGTELETTSLLGVYNHIYTDNFKNSDTGTHYVCFANNIILDENKEGEVIDSLKNVEDNQHSEFRWWSAADILNHPDDEEVHMYTKNYFHPTSWNKES